MMRRPLSLLLLGAPLLARAQSSARDAALGQADCRPGELPAARYGRRFGPLTGRELAMARTAWTTTRPRPCGTPRPTWGRWCPRGSWA
jgi:hypothetical protein